MIKIIPTIGPITQSVKDIKYINKYANIFRLNSSHNTINWHYGIAKKIKLISKENKILIDIPGIKPRTLNKLDISIKKNEMVYFYFKKKPKGLINITNIIPLSNPIPKIQKNIKSFSVSDGTFSFKLLKYNKTFLSGIAQQSFLLKPNKGLNIPLSIYEDNLQKKKYFNFLEKINKIDFDAIGLSFVQNYKIINLIKKKYTNKIIVSKIENFEGLKNVKKICDVSDVIMIDRGDLAAEIGNENLFEAIIKISEVCKMFNKPLIMATENLDSMIQNKLPTKSEIFALAYYNKINVDCIMLSDETTTSKNWKNILNWTGNFFQKQSVKKSSKLILKDTFWDIIKDNLDIPIIIFTKKGLSLNNVENLSNYKNIIVFTESSKVKFQCQFKKNINVIQTDKFDNKNFQKFIKKNILRNSKKIFKISNKIIIIYISYPRKNSRANTAMLVTKDDFK